VKTTELAELPRHFTPPSGLGGSRPRDVRLTPGGWIMTGAAAAACIAAVLVFVFMSAEARRQAENRRALLPSGVTTMGEVSRLWPSDGDDRRRVGYRFVVDGRSYHGERGVSEAVRRQLRIGSPIEVRYVPADPRVNDFGGTPGSGMPFWVPTALAIALLGVGALFLGAVERQRRLLMDGRAAPAVVRSVRTGHSSDGGHQKTIMYEFPLLSGASASGRSTPRKPPAVGSVICVVYDPERPSRSMVYPFPFVRPQ
jgi:hypothetical protein